MAQKTGIIGKTIGKCRILGRLGHGKTSSIFRAYYEPLRKEVAVKILKEDMKASDEIREKFLNEARAIARLDHENIVKVFDVVEDRGYLCIIMELLEGDDCYIVLEEEGAFSPERAVEVATEAAKALEASHRESIVHRDVKPANLMLVGRKGRVKLLDFGLAVEGSTAGHAGTPAYMSPEQIRGKKVDEKSDIYSLGATLYHMLTGKPPYSGKTAKEILEKHLEGKLPTPSRARLDPPVPKVLDPVVKRMMAPVPGYRYTARDLVAALEGLNLEARAVRHRRHAARAASKKSATPLILAAAAVVVVVAVLVVVLASSSGSGGPGPEDRGGPAGDTGGATDTGDLNSLNRAEARENLEALAEREYAQAQSFEARNSGKYDLIIAKYQEIDDRYGATAGATKARAKVKELIAQRDAVQIARERAKREAAMRAGREALDKDLAKCLETYDFPGAQEKLLAFFDEYDEPDEMVERYNWLSYASELIYTLAEEITLSEARYRVSWFKRGYSEDAVIKEATPDHLLIEDRGVEKKELWSFFAPQELGRLAGRVFRSSDTKKHFLVAAFYYSLGLDDPGFDEIQNAKLFDDVGLIDELLKQVKGGKRREIHRTKDQPKKPK